MPFGRLAPLPFRLGAGRDGGISAAEHARFCSDLAAVSRTSPVASMRFRTDSSTGAMQMLRYAGSNGIGIQFAPLVVCAGAPTLVVVSLAAQTNAGGFSVDLASTLNYNWIAFVSNATTGAKVTTSLDADRYTFSFTPDAAIVEYEVTIYGKSAAVNIGDYGGDLDKKDSVTEGESTYAYQWYRILKHSDGTAYTTSDSSVRSWELVAEARALGTSQRISEMLAASSTPGGSDALLGRWALLQGIQGNAPQWKIRRECELRYSDRDASTADTITAGLTAILGSTFASVTTDLGTITAPPLATYCPGYANGDALYDLNGEGVWSSSRAHFTIALNQGSYTNEELADLMSRDVTVWLNANLPATKTWSWTVSTTGFILDTSYLDVDSL
jgi:hypothetical protein